MRSLLVQSILLALCVLGCEQKPSPSAPAAEAATDTSRVRARDVRTPPPAKPTTTRRAFVREVPDHEAFVDIAADVGTERFSKFFVDVDSDEVVFFDVKVFPMHANAVYRLYFNGQETPENKARFERNYALDKPDFLMGYIVHHRALDLWTFSFWEGDDIQVSDVQHMYRALQKHFFHADALTFRPDSADQEAVAAKLQDVPVITNDRIYRERRYQPFNTGRAVGRLEIVRDPEVIPSDPHAVIISTGVLPDLGVVAGVISEDFSSPLSHVALRARARGIPHAGLKKASTRFARLEGTVVYIEVSEQRLTLRPATQNEIAEMEAAPPPLPLRSPRIDLEPHQLKSLQALEREDAPAYGAKAANLGELTEVDSTFEVPVGFAIPVRFYQEHLERHGLGAQVSKATARARAYPKQRAEVLTALQRAIREAPLSPELLDAVMTEIEALELEPGAGVFVRSSTTAEDLPDFNGAGLYDTVPNVRARKDVEQAILQVWASLWNLRAFEEREHFRIDHQAALAAVLVQRGMNATAASVLVTANLFVERDDGRYTITANRGLGLRVVEGRRIPEQLLYDPGERSIQVITRSDDPTQLVLSPEGGVREVANAERGQPVLSDARVEALGRAGEDIWEHVGGETPLDIEWLFVGDALYVVQSRPLVQR